MTDPISRRDFLRLACGTLAAAKLATLIGCHDDDKQDTVPSTTPSTTPNTCPSQQLELYENLNDHFGTLTENDLPALLATGAVSKQRLTPYGRVTFEPNESNNMAYFYHVKDGQPVFAHELEFPGGLTSARVGNQLPGLINMPVKILGKDYTIAEAQLYNDGKMGIRFDSIDSPDQILFVEYLGDGQATQGSGVVTVNSVDVEDGKVELQGTYDANSMRLDKIIYTLLADAPVGDVYVPAGAAGVRQHLAEPEGMLSPNWDLKFNGLTTPLESIVRFLPFQGGYALEFTNKEGLQYNIPLLENTGSALEYRAGTEKLHFVEGTPVQLGDRVILNKPGSDFTRIKEYTNLDTVNHQVEFFDPAAGTNQVTYDASTKIGTLVASGVSYQFLVNEANGTLLVDLNGDGIVDTSVLGASAVYIADKHGAQVHFGTGDAPATQRNVKIRTPGSKIDSKKCDGTAEDVVVGFFQTGPGTGVKAQVLPVQDEILMYYDSASDLYNGMSRYGLNALQQAVDPAAIAIFYPETQRYAQMEFTT